jgi:hypothetical protein
MVNRLLVGVDGSVRAVWDDDMAWLRDESRCEVRRASHVEPTAEAEWTADMGPSGGGVLGPFPLRRDALAAERKWLEENRGL